MDKVSTAFNLVSSLKNTSNFVSAKALATEVGVSVAELRLVAQSLTNHGLLLSSRGRSGGYRLNLENATVSDFQKYTETGATNATATENMTNVLTSALSVTE